MPTAPTRAKRPTDRRKPASKTLTVEVAGQTWTVQPEALDDFRFLGYLDEVDAGNGARLPRVLRMLLGSEQYEQVMEAIADDSGRVSVKAGAEFIGELFEALPQGN